MSLRLILGKVGFLIPVLPFWRDGEKGLGGVLFLVCVTLLACAVYRGGWLFVPSGTMGTADLNMDQISMGGRTT